MDRDQLVLGTDRETLNPKELMALSASTQRGQGDKEMCSALLGQEKAPKPAVLSMLSL